MARLGSWRFILFGAFLFHIWHISVRLKVNTISEAASRKNIPIVYIRQELDGLWGKMISNVFAGGVAIKGNPGTEIDKRVSILSSHIFPKPKSDAFSNPKLERFLIGQMAR